MWSAWASPALHLSEVTPHSSRLRTCAPAAGYLPTYWLKLRLLSMPVLASPLAHNWPVALGGLSQITVGLVATFFAAACIVASDVGAYFVGMPRHQLPDRSDCTWLLLGVKGQDTQ